MKTIQEIYETLSFLLHKEANTIRCATMKENDVILSEADAISRNTLPAVIVILEKVQYENGNYIRSLRFLIYLIDRFRANGEDRARSAWELCEKIQSLFPPSGRIWENALYLPDNFTALPETEHECPVFRFSITVRE